MELFAGYDLNLEVERSWAQKQEIVIMTRL
jgi:hypothetical protein